MQKITISIDEINNNPNLDISERLANLKNKYKDKYSEDDLKSLAIASIKQEYELFANNRINFTEEADDLLEKIKGSTVKEKLNNLPWVNLELANGSMYSEKGKIEAISGQIDAGTGTVQFRANFTNPQKLLSNGNSGSIQFPIDYPHSVVIPESATYEQQGVVYTYVVGKDNNIPISPELSAKIDGSSFIDLVKALK